jgi:hypothetical protein
LFAPNTTRITRRIRTHSPAPMPNMCVPSIPPQNRGGNRANQSGLAPLRVISSQKRRQELPRRAARARSGSDRSGSRGRCSRIMPSQHGESLSRCHDLGHCLLVMGARAARWFRVLRTCPKIMVTLKFLKRILVPIRPISPSSVQRRSS